MLGSFLLSALPKALDKRNPFEFEGEGGLGLGVLLLHHVRHHLPHHVQHLMVRDRDGLNHYALSGGKCGNFLKNLPKD